MEKDYSLIEIDIEELTEALNVLAENPYIIIEDEPFDSPIQKAFKTVKLSYTILRDTNYDIMYNILDKLPRPSYMKSGSCGAFLFGNYNECFGDVSRRCSPISLFSLPKREEGYSVKADPCPSQVWLLKNGNNNSKHYAAIVSSNSDKAKIFIDTYQNSDFKGFTEGEYKLFKDRGVKEVEIYSIGNPKHDTIISKTNLDDIPIEKSKIISNANVKSKDKSNFLWYAALILLIVLTITLACYIGYKYKKQISTSINSLLPSSSKTNSTESQTDLKELQADSSESLEGENSLQIGSSLEALSPPDN